MGSQMSQLGLGQGERGRKSRLVQGEETRLGLKREREGEPGAGLAQGEKVRRERAGTGLGLDCCWAARWADSSSSFLN